MRPLRTIAAQLAHRRNPISAARALGVDVGRDCRFIETSPKTFGSEPYLISIGNHVTITAGVRFITHDGGVWVLREDYPALDVIGPISVDDNVFIGMRAIVLPGVSIGSNVVIAAGSIVTKDVPSNSIVAGVPARVLKPLDAYRASSLAAGVHTKGLSAGEKRTLLTDKFGIKNGN